MASNRLQNQIDYQGGLAQNTLNNLRNTTNNQNATFWNNYMSGVGKNTGSYDEIMGNYRNFTQNAPNAFGNEYGGYQNFASGQSGAALPNQGRINESLAGYSNFANTGGFSPQDLQNIRARAIAPTRSIYSNAQNEVQRQSVLGGMNANPVLQARLAREQSQGISDANINANAGIAQQVQQGKLAGFGGLGQVGLAQSAQEMQNNQYNRALQLQGLSGMTDIDRSRLGFELAGNQGMTSLYGATPGLASTFGNQVLGSTGQMTEQQGLQNQLGLGIMGAQYNRERLPSGFQTGLGNASSILGLIGQGASAFKSNPDNSISSGGGYYDSSGNLVPGPAAPSLGGGNVGGQGPTDRNGWQSVGRRQAWF